MADLIRDVLTSATQRSNAEVPEKRKIATQYETTHSHTVTQFISFPLNVHKC